MLRRGNRQPAGAKEAIAMRTGRRRTRLALAALLAIGAAMIGCSDKDEDKDREESPGYLRTMVIAKDRSEETTCQANLRDIYTALRVYAAAEEQYPPGLVRRGGWEGLPLPAGKLHCPSGSRREYVYIPDQDPTMPQDNVLLYEAEAVHRGRCHVLRLSGRIEKLTPAERDAAVEETKRRIAER